MVSKNLVNDNTNCTVDQFNKMLDICHQYNDLVGSETMDIFATIFMSFKDYGVLVTRVIEYIEFSENSINFVTTNGGAVLKEDHYETIYCDFDEVIYEMERQLNEELKIK